MATSSGSTQVIGNLLSNASKFSPDGARIHVTVAQVARPVQISVRDDRRGHRCADPAARVRSVRAGRSVARSLARRPRHRAHGREAPGRIARRTHRGRQRRARAWQRVHDHAAASRARETRRRTLTRLAPPARRILIVDDNADSAMSLAVLLEMEGHEVRTARDGMAALDELEQFDARAGAAGHRIAGHRRLCDSRPDPAAPRHCDAVPRGFVRVCADGGRNCGQARVRRVSHQAAAARAPARDSRAIAGRSAAGAVPLIALVQRLRPRADLHLACADTPRAPSGPPTARRSLHRRSCT